ncbi:MAG: hypothetical protein LBE12_18545, partial [Planctomycetaceae bacterium]|nr:hypothetical protein [Planctomycetaceae bacterium]
MIVNRIVGVETGEVGKMCGCIELSAARQSVSEIAGNIEKLKSRSEKVIMRTIILFLLMTLTCSAQTQIISMLERWEGTTELQPAMIGA